jgi:hypothetical protein
MAVMKMSTRAVRASATKKVGVNVSSSRRYQAATFTNAKRVVRARDAPEDQQAAAAPEPTPTPAPAAVAKGVSFGDVMNFSGLGPERINGRLAMLGFVAAAGAELSSNEAVTAQISDAAGPIAGAFALFIAASLIPMLKGAKLESFGPFTPNAEMLNGRAAMLGFLLLIGFEAGSGSAFF